MLYKGGNSLSKFKNITKVIQVMSLFLYYDDLDFPELEEAQRIVLIN